MSGGACNGCNGACVRIQLEGCSLQCLCLQCLCLYMTCLRELGARVYSSQRTEGRLAWLGLGSGSGLGLGLGLALGGWA